MSEPIRAPDAAWSQDQVKNLLAELDEQRRLVKWWSENYWRQIHRLHKAYANLGCVDESGSAMHYTGEVGPKDCTCRFCVEGVEASG
jgi:hypothetical protein